MTHIPAATKSPHGFSSRDATNPQWFGRRNHRISRVAHERTRGARTCHYQTRERRPSKEIHLPTIGCCVSAGLGFLNVSAIENNVKPFLYRCSPSFFAYMEGRNFLCLPYGHRDRFHICRVEQSNILASLPHLLDVSDMRSIPALDS